LRWTADPPRPFQLCPVPICSALRFLVTGLPPVFIYRRFHVYLKEPRIPIESPLWYDRFFWQNPVRVTRPVPPGRLPFSSTLFTFGRVGLPVNSHSVRLRPFGPCRPIPICRLSSHDSSLSTFLARFKSVDLLRLFPALRPSSLASSLATFSVRFRSCDLLRSSCDPNLSVSWFLSTGDSNYSFRDGLSKSEKLKLEPFFNRKYQ